MAKVCRGLESWTNFNKMRRLLLASYAAYTLDLISEWFSKPISELTAAVITTASDPYNDKSFVDVDRNKLVKMGFEVVDIDLKNKTLSDLKSELENIDLILMAGGNTFYLLDHIRKSGFDVLLPDLLDKGVIYVGSSAGSLVCCSTIESAKRFDDATIAPDLKNYIGLGFFDKAIIPHAQKEKYFERIELTKNEMKEVGQEVVILTDDEAIMITGDEVKKVAKM